MLLLTLGAVFALANADGKPGTESGASTGRPDEAILEVRAEDLSAAVADDLRAVKGCVTPDGAKEIAEDVLVKAPPKTADVAAMRALSTGTVRFDDHVVCSTENARSVLERSLPEGLDKVTDDDVRERLERGDRLVVLSFARAGGTHADRLERIWTGELEKLLLASSDANRWQPIAAHLAAMRFDDSSIMTLEREALAAAVANTKKRPPAALLPSPS